MLRTSPGFGNRDPRAGLALPEAFWGWAIASTGSPGPPVSFGGVLLWNPTASTRILHLDRVLVSMEGTSGVKWRLNCWLGQSAGNPPGLGSESAYFPQLYLSSTNVQPSPARLGQARMCTWSPTATQIAALNNNLGLTTLSLFMGDDTRPFDAVNGELTNIRLGPGTFIGIISEETFTGEMMTTWHWHEETY